MVVNLYAAKNIQTVMTATVNKTDVHSAVAFAFYKNSDKFSSISVGNMLLMIMDSPP